MKSAIILIITFSLIFAQQLRFKDDELMRAHHHQYNPSNDPITVYLIPHSHDDVGWLKTVDQYFYGDKQQIQQAAVQYTIDTVVTELKLNPDYTFSIVQTAFLYRWWNGANQTQRSLMRKYVDNGQIEIINAGWCMSDEANPYYQDIIDQMTIGLRWVKQTLGVVPTIGWHIDPFGHQSTNAAIFNQLGFNAWFFARADYQDKNLRLNRKALQMVWHPFQYSGIDNSIFTHITYYMYAAPPGFCFDNTCKDQPIKDDPTLQDYNIEIKSKSLVDYFKSMALHYRSNNLLHCLGQDFTFSNARLWYKNIDKLIKFINNRPELGVNIKYSTPSQYLQAIHQQKNVYPTKYDDFFPYADRTHGYWTGYFVSRVSLKGFIKDLGRYAQIIRSHISLLKLANISQYITDHPNQVENSIWQLQMALGILQHHDAVAGTAKQAVTYDYFNIGVKGKNILNSFYYEVIRQQVNLQIGQYPSRIHGTQWNSTQSQWGISTQLTAGRSVLVHLYNPGSKGTYVVKLKIAQSNLNIIGNNNSTISGDLICSNTKNTNDCELIFSLTFEQTSYNFVKLVPLKSGGSANIVKLKTLTILQPSYNWTISATASIKLTKSSQKFQLKCGNIDFPFTLAYDHYQSYAGTGQKSGAYIFRPSDSTVNSIKKYSTIKNFHYAEGTTNLVIVLQGDKTYTKLYFNKYPKYVENYGFEIETFVDSISISDKKGKEIVLSLLTNIQNDNTFYTDSNGMEEQKRIFNYRPTWQLNNDELVAGNYYPISSHIGIIDQTNKQRVNLLVDRAQGGGVIREGHIQVMIHRRLVDDDERGVFEALNQTDHDGNGITQKFRHYVVLGNQHRVVQKWNDQRILITWSPTTNNNFIKKSIPKPIFSVPESVKLYLRPFNDNSYLLRFHNFDTTSENSVSIPEGYSIVQYTLGGNLLLDDWKVSRYTWKEQPYNDYKPEVNQIKSSHIRIRRQGDIILKPFEIRTFKLFKD